MEISALGLPADHIAEHYNLRGIGPPPPAWPEKIGRGSKSYSRVDCNDVAIDVRLDMKSFYIKRGPAPDGRTVTWGRFGGPAGARRRPAQRLCGVVELN